MYVGMRASKLRSSVCFVYNANSISTKYAQAYEGSLIDLSLSC